MNQRQANRIVKGIAYQLIESYIGSGRLYEFCGRACGGTPDCPDCDRLDRALDQLAQRLFEQGDIDEP